MNEAALALLPVAPAALGWAILFTALAAAVQGTLGFGFAIVSVPVLSLVDPRLAPVPQLLVVGVLTVGTFLRERGDADLRGIGWIVVGRIPGTVLGIGLLKLANQATLDLLLAGLVLLAVACLATGVNVPHTRINRIGVGTVSGIFAVVASIGGPPVALLYRGERGPTIRATLAAVFTVGLVITAAGRFVAGEISWLDLHIAAFLLPPLLLGLYLSGALRSRVEGRPLRIGTLGLAVAAALGLVGRVLFT